MGCEQTFRALRLANVLVRKAVLEAPALICGDSLATFSARLSAGEAGGQTQTAAARCFRTWLSIHESTVIIM